MKTFSLILIISLITYINLISDFMRRMFYYWNIKTALAHIL